MPPRLSDVQKGQIVALFEEGYCISAIARRLMFSKSTVALWVNRYQEEGHVQRRVIPGRPHVTSPEEDAAIVQASIDNHFLTSKHIRGEIGVACSRQTIIRRLSAAGLYARWAAKKSFSPPHSKQ